MKQELDELLCKKYPKIFVNRHGDMRDTLMCWGFSHGDGWFNLLDSACALIQSHIDQSRKRRADQLKFNRALKRALNGDMKGIESYYTHNGKLAEWAKNSIVKDIEKAEYREVSEACRQVIAVQVKEKFGTLRFYYDGGDAFVYGVVSMAEYLSGSTCEECGAPGKRQGGGWIRTVCDVHAKKTESDVYVEPEE